MHTPGPWTVKIEDSALRIRAEAEYVTVASIPLDPEDKDDAARADARLIAAAPDLLAALRALEAHIGPYNWRTTEELAVLEAARAAIAKAGSPYGA